MKVTATVAIVATGILALAGAYAASRGEPSHDVVTAEQASAALGALYEVRADSNLLCSLGTSKGNCEALLQGAGDAPKSAPTIVCSVRYAGDSAHSAGLIVRIHTEGTFADTESLVLSVDQEARYMNPVYWSGARVSDEGVAAVTARYSCE